MFTFEQRIVSDHDLTVTPKLAWKTYLRYFRNPIAIARPNAGHLALGELEKLVKTGPEGENRSFTVITQNVDGLHQRGGNTEVYELHGTVYRHICSYARHLQPPVAPENEKEYYSIDNPPTCVESGCGSYLRPDAVLFTEGLPGDAFSGARRAISNMQQDDVMLVIGTSGLVYPAASFPETVANRNHSVIVEINPERSQLTELIEQSAHGTFINAGAGDTLSKILAHYKEATQQESN
jgi:NAD-dependent deacetylase